MPDLPDVTPTIDEQVDVHNPVAVEEAIRKIANRTAKGVSVCAQALDDWRRAEREYDVAYARAYRAAGGPQYGRKYEAVVATEKEREARDDAEVAYKYADRLARFLEGELSAWQSIGKSVNNMFAAAGTGQI